jgi:Zn-finger nucleic acid-binding protein
MRTKQVEIFPGRVEKLYKCPKCKVYMEKMYNHDKVVIDKCPVCGGIWLDKGELNVIGKLGFFKYIRNYFKK